MTGPFKAAALQFPIDMGDVAANRKRAFRLVGEAVKRGAKLCVLPEMWSSGFDNERLLLHAESTPGILGELSALARETGAVIAGSLPERVGRGVCNTLYVTGPDGAVAGFYRKAHLFSPSGEDKWFRRGTGGDVIPTPFGAAGPLICYDIRFPELARKYFLAGATLLLVPAQWPAARKAHWDTLLTARAIENQLFVVAANATGTSGPFTFPGGSVIVSPTGERLAEGGEDEGVVLAEIDPKKADEFRRRIPCAADRNEKAYRKTPKGKVIPRARARELFSRLRADGRRIVFTNGCFDILHAGHARYLLAASLLGDVLVVGMNGDGSVRRLKGEGRPVQRQGDRAYLLASLACVSHVVVFGEDTPERLIRDVCPHVLVKGADWKGKEIAGGAWVRDRGGEVRFLPFLAGRSTTSILERAREGT